MNYLQNTETALRYWLTVPEANVMPKLAAWRSGSGSGPHTCGTIGCFGGWLPAMPEFAAMGVTAGLNGSPVAPNQCVWNAVETASYLFGPGGHRLIATRGGVSGDRELPATASDHAIVTHRLQKHIKRLQQAKAKT